MFNFAKFNRVVNENREACVKIVGAHASSGRKHREACGGTVGAHASSDRKNREACMGGSCGKCDCSL